MHSYQPGEIAYIIESNRYIMEGKILRRSGNLYIFRFIEGGGTQVHAGRLYPTEEAAQNALDQIRRHLSGNPALAFG